MSESFSFALVQCQTVVTEAYAAKQISVLSYRRWQEMFLTLAESGKALNARIRAGNVVKAQATVGEMLRDLDRLARADTLELPENYRNELRISLESVRSALLIMAVM